MEILNNREIAIGIWLLVVIGWGAWSASIRDAFGKVVLAFCSRKILIPFGLAVAYIVVVVVALSMAGLWSWGQLKNTILWSISVAAVALFRVPGIAEDEHYFRHAVRDSFKIIAVLEFVIGFYSFSLWIEILIVPIATLLVAMQAFSEGKDVYAPAPALIGWLLAALGIGIAAYALYMLVSDFGQFATAGTLTDFALPIVLTLLFLLFLYFLAIFVTYENAFIRLDLTFREPQLRRYAKRAALAGFHVRRQLLKRWLRNIQSRTPLDRVALKASIAQVKVLERREENPPVVPLSEGWSPYDARDFLIPDQLVPGDYHQCPFDDQEWFAASPYLEIGDGILPNNIAYYIEGDEHIARTLKLVVNFNDHEGADHTRARFAEVAEHLIIEALDEEPPSAVRSSILAETPKTLAIRGKTIRIVRESWPSGRGYEMRLYLTSDL